MSRENQESNATKSITSKDNGRSIEDAPSVRENRWGIHKISIDILTAIKLKPNRVAQEVGKQLPTTKATNEVFDTYYKKLEAMKQDIKEFAGQQYRKCCLRKAALLGMKINDDGGIVTTWGGIGADFSRNPTWRKAIILYHSLYTSMDESPEFKKMIEKEWMKLHSI
jgi:hypothetical protein